MADNIKITPATEGALEDYALEDIGGVKHQLAKMEFGADGVATKVSAVNPLPVTMPGASTEATLSALVASLDELSAKVSACDTNDVALDAATLAALESITAVISGPVEISNFPAAIKVSNFPVESDSTPALTIDQIREAPLDVALDPEYQILIDQTQTTVVGGKTKKGAVLPQAADVNGAQMLSDAPTQITGQAFSATGLGSILCSFDTQGYQSISLQIFGTWAGTISFFGSNTGQDWSAVAGTYMQGGSGVVTTTTTSGIFLLPASTRYFKAVLTTYTSGTALCAAYLRSQPWIPSISNTNTASVGGTVVVNAGVAGVQAVGGNIAPGIAPTTNPLNVGGWDGVKTRRFMTDINGAQQVVGAPYNPNTNPIITKIRESGSYGLGVEEALQQILVELQYHSYVLARLPEINNSANYQLDDPEQFRKDLVIS